jgi:hypothetical protein
MNEIGDKSDTNLSPKKLAEFYKAVGGNYDCECRIAFKESKTSGGVANADLYTLPQPCSKRCRIRASPIFGK